MREYRNFSCHQCAAVGSDAGAAVVRARGWPKSSRMWRQILPILSAAVRTACVSYAVQDSNYISVWLVSAVPWTLARRSCCPWQRLPRNRSPSPLLQPTLSSRSQPATRKYLLPVHGHENYYQHITFRDSLFAYCREKAEIRTTRKGGINYIDTKGRISMIEKAFKFSLSLAFIFPPSLVCST